MIPAESTLLRIYLNSNERWPGAPLYRDIKRLGPMTPRIVPTSLDRPLK